MEMHEEAVLWCVLHACLPARSLCHGDADRPLSYNVTARRLDYDLGTI